MFKAFKSTLGVIFGFLFVCFILSVVIIGGMGGEEKPEKVGTESEKSEGAESNDKFKIGDKVKFSDYIVTVNSLENPYHESNEFMQPKDGFKAVAIDVSYENTSGEAKSYNSLDWTLHDSDGYNYDTFSMATKEPTLSSGTLNAGGKVRGWITFEVPNDSKDYKLQFKPNLFSNSNVEIELF